MVTATKATQKRLDAAVSAFNVRYANPKQWGEERWYNSLYPALAQPTAYCAVINLYAVSEDEGKLFLSDGRDNSLQRVEVPDLYIIGSEKEQHSPSTRIVCYERKATIDDGNDVQVSRVAGMPFPAPKHGPSSAGHLLTHWNMDAASVLAAQMLDVKPGDSVLDMCAAPGGKSVVLAQCLFPGLHLGSAPDSQAQAPIQGSLHANEFDASRYKRLSANLKSYLPDFLFPTPEIPQGAVRVLNKDLSVKGSAASLPFGTNGYDKILVDAPCSSERHIIHAYEKAKASGQVADEMLNWKSSHTATLVKTQTGLLHTALKAAKVGGRIVYATCALGFGENDGVIEKVLETMKAERKRAKKDGLAVESWDVEFQLGTEMMSSIADNPTLQRMTQSTRYGRIALPDHGGWGPLYFSIIIKIPRTKRSKDTTKTNNAGIKTGRTTATPSFNDTDNNP